MHKEELLTAISDCYAELKDFQKATAINIDKKFFEEKLNRHLLADEVGLGKTIVAKGVIAKAMERHLNSPRRKRPFRVVYICSNQALTGQNLTKLNIFKKTEFVDTDKGRLVFQAFKENNNAPYQISSLTPSTSFRLKKGTGIKEERQLIWLILSEHYVFSKQDRIDGLKLALLGNIDSQFIKNWLNKLEHYKQKNLKKVRPQVFKSYKQRVDRATIDLSNWYFSPIRKELSMSGQTKLRDILVKYSEVLNPDNVKHYVGPKRILGSLRRLLTDACLDFLDADLYILDEFQRFKDLIETNKEKQSEAAIIAQKVFGKKNAKVLMLSATPFKPFTTAIDAGFKEEHHKEFKDVISFLFNGRKEKLTVYEENRKIFFDLLRRPEGIKEGNIYEKERLETLYREVISRTERLIVSDDKNTLLKTQYIQIEPIKEDISNFIATDRIVNKLGEVSGKGNHTLVDFSKSAPYPLSFMDKYKVKEDLRTESQSKTGLEGVIRKQAKAWLDLDKVQKYEHLGNIPNGNMRVLLNKALMEHDLWRQLWIAPSLPYYELRGSFRNARNNSKILVFSKWRMVPRAIAAILSYESERLSVGNQNLKIEGEKQYTPDFYPNNPGKRQPRKPGKILALKMKAEKPQTMSAFALLYPSLTLASCYDLKDNIKMTDPHSLASLKELIKERIKAMIKEAQLEKLTSKSQKTTNWYWVAPLLLDKFYNRSIYENWLINEKFWESSILYKKTSQHTDSLSFEDEAFEDDDVNSNVTVLHHFQELKKVFSDPEGFDLGEFPDDLYDVLAHQVIASPAVCSLRMLKEHFQEEDENILLNRTLDIASEFHALFDKPESIAVIKIASIERDDQAHDLTYWMDVLEYCTNGNLQAVLDEFAHLLKSDYKSINAFTDRIRSSINIRTTNLRVDNGTSFLEKKHSVLRSHYAVDFGTQNMDVEKGLNRIKSILANFNSPFRPFVLASTSIGQEGLDFHFYCRKVMHWNLPANPIDVEQREGRVNRFKGLVIRQSIANKYARLLPSADGPIWDFLFAKAELLEGKQRNKSQLVPYWHLEPEKIYIERIAPLIPYSREIKQMERILTTLTLYRLTFGQPRQEELVEALYKKLQEKDLDKIRKKLLINLSPVIFMKSADYQNVKKGWGIWDMVFRKVKRNL